MIFILITILKILSIVIPFLFVGAYFKHEGTKIFIQKILSSSNLKNPNKLIVCIIGLAIIGLAAIVVDPKFYIYIGSLILFFFFIFAIFSKREKIKKYISKNLTLILEDEMRFSNYFKKRFPMSYKYLPLVKIVILLLLLTAIGMDYQEYSRLLFNISLEENFIPAHKEYYSQ